jgi:hypothetical protein
MHEHAGAPGGTGTSEAKRQRTFVCRDALWEGLEQVALELECSVDALVNDAIKHYVRQRLTRRPERSAADVPPQIARALPPLPPPPPRAAPMLAPPVPTRLPPPRPPPLPRDRAWSPVPPGATQAQPKIRLTATYADQTVCVETSGFVIGRGKASGLSIKDPNISRQHAMIEEQGGLFWLVDMGSVNGTYVNGERITRKALAEGDVARICDHEIRFSFSR